MNIAQPSAEAVSKYLKKWEEEEEYVLQDWKDRSLIKLFSETYPRNDDLDEVLIKVSSMNALYNAIFTSNYKFPAAKHIVELNIDQRLLSKDLSLVNDIAKVEVDSSKPKIVNLISFATKYFSLHFKKEFPIYDGIVKKMLLYFKKKDNFFEFTGDSLKCYSTLNEVLVQFRETYGLESFTFKEIDRYLWTAGKEQSRK